MRVSIKKTLKSLAGRAAEIAGIGTLPSRKALTIIAFHRINDELPEDGLTCNSEKFEKFCIFFRRNFKVVPLSAQIAGMRTGEDMGGTLSITLDDGYIDNFKVAAPILRRLQLPATFFVTTSFVGTSIVAPWDDYLTIRQGWMNWDQLRALVADGFDIGSHSDTHVNLSAASPNRVLTDLQISKEKLEKELGVPARLFAYPFGGRDDISDRSREIVQELGFDCCLSCFGGINARTTNPYHLKRIGIGEWFASPYQFTLEFLLGRV